jgi:hypothetical protein
MSDEPQRKPIFWPALFLTAFILGAILWALWMSRVIRQTREDRGGGFFVPASTNAPGQK